MANRAVFARPWSVTGTGHQARNRSEPAEVKSASTGTGHGPPVIAAFRFEGRNGQTSQVPSGLDLTGSKGQQRGGPDPDHGGMPVDVQKPPKRRGRYRRGFPPEAIAAAAALKREQTKAKIAAGTKRCCYCKRDMPLHRFRPIKGPGIGWSSKCYGCEPAAMREWRRRRRQQEADAAAEAARTTAQAAARDARRAAEFSTARAVVQAAQERRQAVADLAAMDVELATLVVAVKWRLGLTASDAQRVARLVVPRPARRGFGADGMRDLVESFVWLDDADAAALARQAGVTLPEPQHRRRRAAA